MRIVIDGQALQSPDPQGTALDSLRTLIGGLVSAWSAHEVYLTLGSYCPDRIQEIRAWLRPLLPPEKIRVWYGLGSDAASHASWRATAEVVREALIARLDPDFLVAAFDRRAGLDKIVFSLGRLARIPTAILVSGSEGEIPARLLKAIAKADFILADSSERIALAEPGLDCVKLMPLEPLCDLGERVEMLHRQFRERRRPAHSARPKLAFVSPLPPERSGISYYSAELLPALSAHYEIDVIIHQMSVEDAWVSANCGIRDARWFSKNAKAYDRILYHFGNSRFHNHMFPLLEKHPGVVVLHDFFLSGVVSARDEALFGRGSWSSELYRSHGWAAAAERALSPNVTEVSWRYPCSGGVINNATGVIVHSDSGRDLALKWHGSEVAHRTTIIPHLRASPQPIDRATARRILGLRDDDFVVCSFGSMSPTKLNHRLLDAWITSTLSRDPACRLIFVGGPIAGSYGQKVTDLIGGHDRISITGWTSPGLFQNYLAAADAAVQLRGLSRGESSGTVLDCMNRSLPVIVNAHASMAELPRDAVLMLPDEFTDAELVQALERLRSDAALRSDLGNRSAQHVRTFHEPSEIASCYKSAIEAFYERPHTALEHLGPELAASIPDGSPDTAVEIAAACASLSTQSLIGPRQLLVDVSVVARSDLKTGIQRAVRALVKALIASPPEGFRVEPIYLAEGTFHYARRFTAALLGIRRLRDGDAPVEWRSGDIYLMPDLAHDAVIANRRLYRAMRNHGVSVNFMVHDLLPISCPQFFPTGADKWHAEWLAVIAEADRAICVSRAVADELRAWIAASPERHLGRVEICHSHHGHDIAASAPTRGLPWGARRVLHRLSEGPSFLMVGTVEPRKAYAQSLDAFELLWKSGSQAKLVIVGKAGWMVKPLITRLRRHRERDRRLFWFEGASDEFLDRIYGVANCLLMASHGEGFGLPLIEAASRGVPIIARDLPVFREIAGENAFYFRGSTGAELKTAIEAWMGLERHGLAPAPTSISCLTWAQSAERLKQLLIGDVIRSESSLATGLADDGADPHRHSDLADFD